MKAVILAAGTASRLRPLTNNTPKCLLNVGDKPILELTINNLISNNIDDIVIVTGFEQQQIKDFIAKRYSDIKVSYIYNEVYDSTNNIFSLWLAKESLLGNDIILLDSDIIFDHRIITRLCLSNYENCLALKKHKLGDEEIKVKANKDGRVLEISKIVSPLDAIGESIGIEKFGKKSLTTLFEIIDNLVIEQKKVNIFYEVAFEQLIKEGGEIFAVDTSDLLCMEIDTAEDLKTAEELVKSNIN